jgi:hypothetical protein
LRHETPPAARVGDSVDDHLPAVLVREAVLVDDQRLIGV